MKRITTRIAALSVLAGACVFLFGSSINSNQKQEQYNPSVKSLVSHLEIVSTKMLGPNVLEVMMRNGYQKDLTAVVAFKGPDSYSRRDYIFAEMEQDQNLSPGATDRFVYTIDSKEEENILIK